MVLVGTWQGDVIYLHEPLLWTLRQHAVNGVAGPDSLARAIGAVATPLLEITARVGEYSGRLIFFERLVAQFLTHTLKIFNVAEYTCAKLK